MYGRQELYEPGSHKVCGHLTLTDHPHTGTFLCSVPLCQNLLCHAMLMPANRRKRTDISQPHSSDVSSPPAILPTDASSAEYHYIILLVVCSPGSVKTYLANNPSPCALTGDSALWCVANQLASAQSHIYRLYKSEAGSWHFGCCSPAQGPVSRTVSFYLPCDLLFRKTVKVCASLHRTCYNLMGLPAQEALCRAHATTPATPKCSSKGSPDTLCTLLFASWEVDASPAPRRQRASS